MQESTLGKVIGSPSVGIIQRKDRDRGIDRGSDKARMRVIDTNVNDTNINGAASTTTTMASNKLAWIAWSSAAIFYCFQFFLRVAPSVLVDDLMRDFSIDATTFGTLVSFYSLGYASMQIPLGVLMDKFGPRRLISVATLLCSVGTLIFALSPNIHYAELGRLLIGTGAACGFLGTMKVGTLWFHSKKLPFISGITVILGATGAMLASGPLSLLNDIVGGWRSSFMILAGLGAVVSLSAWTFIRDNGPYLVRSNASSVSSSSSSALEPVPADEKESIFKGFNIIIRIPQIWIMAFFGFFVYSALASLPDSWGTQFLMATYGLTEAKAGTLMSLTYVGLAIGSLIFPLLCNRFPLKTLLKFSPLGAAIMSFIILYAPNLSIEGLAVCLLCFGTAVGGHILYFSIACTHAPIWASGVTIGFVNMITMISGVVYAPLVGKILDFLWDGSVVNGAHVFKPSMFQTALTIVPVTLSIAFILTFFIKEGSASSDSHHPSH
ncbi:MAG: MFS transporter [Oligoflexia bacterium]|nr:MFS transporter [Oligoflexia bacterium]